MVETAISADTLFIHGSSVGGGSLAHHASKEASEIHISANCTSACGSAISGKLGADMGAFCDPSCSSKWSPAGPRFDGHNCGAGDASEYGESCRLCYTNQTYALGVDRELAPSGLHVVMCDTKNPPQALECSDDCQSTTDAVRVLIQVFGRRDSLH